MAVQKVMSACPLGKDLLCKCRGPSNHLAVCETLVGVQDSSQMGIEKSTDDLQF
jgi:hypothetical protein